MDEDPLLKGTMESRICPICDKIVDAFHNGYGDVVLTNHQGKKFFGMKCAGSRLIVEGEVIIRPDTPRRGAGRSATAARLPLPVEGQGTQPRGNGLDSFAQDVRKPSSTAEVESASPLQIKCPVCNALLVKHGTFWECPNLQTIDHRVSVAGIKARSFWPKKVPQVQQEGLSAFL